MRGTSTPCGAQVPHAGHKSVGMLSHTGTMSFTGCYRGPLNSLESSQGMSLEITTWFPDRIAASLFTIAFFLWAASEVFNTFWFRRSLHTPGAQGRDRWSYWIILLIVWGSIIISFLARIFSLGVFHNDLQYLGLVLVALGVTFREWAVMSLGSFFTVTVTIVSNQTLVKNGPYHWLRHPSYSGSILSLVGFPLALGTWVGGLLVLFLSLGGYLYRVRIEERALLEVFGDEYRDYMQHTWRFFPGL
jgi:protein-S-isoprenylcysteine O-methyltransferase Ste14